VLFRRLTIVIAATVGVVAAVGLNLGVSRAQGTASIGQSFTTSETNIAPGALVSTAEGNSEVVLSNTRNADRLAGIIGSKPLVEVSDGKGSVQVVTEGSTLGLVSDINGPVTTGDRVTASPIDGVGMKVSATGLVVGTAQADLESVATTEHTVTDQYGNKRTVHVGAVPIRVNVVALTAQSGQPVAPAFLQNLANSVAGRHVSAVRVLFATLIFVILFLLVTVLLYAAIRSSLISLGRNPFSEGVLRKALTQSGLLVSGIAVSGLLIVYLVLKL
jgi:hypothetical protein